MSSSLYADNDADPDITISAEDPYQAVSAAVSLPPDSLEQAEALISAAAVLESQPAYIEQICPALLDNMVGSQESMLKVWVMEMVGIGLGRAKLSMEAKTSCECRAPRKGDLAKPVRKDIKEIDNTDKPSCYRVHFSERKGPPVDELAPARPVHAHRQARNPLLYLHVTAPLPSDVRLQAVSSDT
jgi:hypothetical protein